MLDRLLHSIPHQEKNTLVVEGMGIVRIYLKCLIKGFYGLLIPAQPAQCIALIVEDLGIVGVYLECPIKGFYGLLIPAKLAVQRLALVVEGLGIVGKDASGARMKMARRGSTCTS